MPRTRVLLVDDSAFFRKVVTDGLGADPQIEIVGSASNGRLALSRIPQVNPDVVILDVEMPEMDGLQTLGALRRIYPKLPVVMFSSLTERGAQTTVDALLLGANDYVTKPTAADAKDRIRELLRKVKAVAGLPAGSSQRPGTAGGDAKTGGYPPYGPLSRPDALLIGSSTGGPNALAAVFSALPADLPLPILIVQHMPPMFTKCLADRLSSSSKIPTVEASDGQAIEPGHAYIAPGDFHMRPTRQGTRVVLTLDKEPPENSCRPAVDVMFRAAADIWGRGCLATVLTGMGQDGYRGAQVIRERGGRIWAQDEASSVVWGMPGIIARAGLAERVLPLTQIGQELARRAKHTPGAHQEARTP
jgi:two-component system chemotaxis response regulator CheB